MTFLIRPSAPEDYEALAEIASAVEPDYPETAEKLRYDDEKRNPSRKFARFVGVADGEVVAVCGYEDWPEGSDRFVIWIEVHPQHQGKGYGSALYEFLLEAVKPFDPPLIRADSRENRPRARKFLADRGFIEEMLEKESALDVDRFDPAAWEKEVERVLMQGITLTTYARLRAEATHLEDLHQRLDDLHWAVELDIPNPDTPVRRPHSEFLKRFENPLFRPEGNIYALDGDRIIGGSILWGRPTDRDMNTGMTGTLREYRKRGIATAMKIKALTYARQQGARKVRTQNEENNVGMLGINYRLGFKPEPAWIFLVKHLKEPQPKL